MEQSASDKAAFIGLNSGEALSELEATLVARSEPSRVVVLAGPPGSGKTTILTSLFEEFLTAPFANYLFAGSRTLIGLERRCHDSRVNSGRPTAHTAHTPVRDVVEFLHLRVANARGQSNVPWNLLLSDVSGERFRHLRDSTTAVAQMGALRRADRLVLVIDGAKLVRPELRHSARTDARVLLRALMEANALSSSCRVDCVISKWDVVVSAEDQSLVMAFVEETKAALLSAVGSALTMAFFEVAARPESDQLPFAHGLPTLFRAWLEGDGSESRPIVYVPEVRASDREMSHYSQRLTRSSRFDGEYDVRRI